MDAFPADAVTIGFSARRSVFVVASTPFAAARTERAMSGFGMRLAGSVTLDEAHEAFDEPFFNLLWVELDCDGGPAMDAFLRRLDREASHERYAIVVAAPRLLLDEVAACMASDYIQLIIDPDDAARAAALAIASATESKLIHLCDVGSDNSSEQLRRLGDEVSRIAAALARLSSDAAPLHAPEPSGIPQMRPELLEETVQRVIRARRIRERYFSAELFPDPAWDMMLDLLRAEVAQLRVSVSSLCVAAAVPATTALRWLKQLVADGIFVRIADPHDRRRVFVELAPETSLALRRYFAEIGQADVV